MNARNCVIFRCLALQPATSNLNQTCHSNSSYVICLSNWQIRVHEQNYPTVVGFEICLFIHVAHKL